MSGHFLLVSVSACGGKTDIFFHFQTSLNCYKLNLILLRDFMSMP